MSPPFTCVHPELDSFSVGHVAWILLLALQPYGRFGGLRLLAALILFVCLIHLGWRSILEGKYRSPSRLILVGYAFVVWSIVVSVLGPYPEDSAHALRKGLLIQLLLFSGGLVFVKSANDAWRAMAILLASFMLLSLLSLGEIISFWHASGLALIIPRTHDDWWGGYGATGACLAPLILAWALRPGNSRFVTAITLVFLALVAALVFLYWSRTPLLVMIVSSMFVLILARKWRAFAFISSLTVALMLVLALMPGQHMSRYQSLLQPNTYISNAGLSLRPELWRGVTEVIAERPLQGYGYGWKKLAWVVNENGFAERWQQEGGSKAAYFLGADGKASEGRVNPHNYFLQAAFEVGLIGLFMAMLFWGLIIKNTISVLKNLTNRDNRHFAVAICGLLLAYWMSNITNGQWEGRIVNITLALSACLLACLRACVQGEPSKAV